MKKTTPRDSQYSNIVANTKKIHEFSCIYYWKMLYGSHINVLQNIGFYMAVSAERVTDHLFTLLQHQEHPGLHHPELPNKTALRTEKFK